MVNTKLTREQLIAAARAERLAIEQDSLAKRRQIAKLQRGIDENDARLRAIEETLGYLA
ncbi:hypothetical protein SEA_TIERRA_41 [Mycobacterium phage Tierra]|uniref:Uncharacterized protein n=2 Tax=Unicornvirus TaxID=2948939 RepID=A0A222ZMA8_9CAUD|nr:hypothetical protein I5G79_gp56 [Mycobacterium phage Bryler]YP_009951416.1 hypothetical protein I5G80_gp044 [Mycobacterium phage Krueger]ASR85340.1 hypothetical protein SEA_PHRANK_41 [Mycobacterium phage Phrank]ASR85441.1 hypothetical protein SEA_CAIN_41 [Mycobacterium phage Cain]WNM68330.1 hypothetical protein SEA_TIERRA_41 [Mycobacterium phage Tierra]ASR85545.1 hypothetical protein SEA_KRUEGER_44 [Mycobacterium phage Krueger]QGH80417.1 hypothetical protein SEA_BRYLER_41 [Mycobacterium ph